MPTHRRHAVRIAAVGILLLCMGCFGGVSNPGYFPWIEPHEDVIRTHARPTGEGYFANFDREAYKLEATPVDITLPVRSQQVVVATVFDESGKPRRKRRVDWQLDGVGAIVEVDESGYLPGRGGKVDGKYAWSHTDYSEHPLPPGLRDASGVTIGAGQTWLAVTSALEGTTSVMVFAPEISDKERNRVYVRIHWVDAKCTFPTAATARAGTEYALATSVFHATDQQPASGYRVRYRIVDGPKAAMTASAIAPTTELTVPTDGNGLAKVSIKETEAKFGANRVQIEILKPDAERIGGFLVVDRQEVTVSWDAPQVHLDVQSAKTTQINQEFPVTYSVASTGTVATDPLIVNVTIPAGMELVRTEPKATQDPQKGVLIWNLDPIGPGKQQTIQAVYRPASVGSFSLAARVRTDKPDDPLNTQGTAQVQVVETKLSTSIDGPKTAFVGEKVPYQILVSNPGTGMAENVKVSLVFDNGLALADGTAVFEKVIESLPPGGSQTIDVDLTPKQAGRSMLHAQATAGSLLAQSPPAAVDVKQPQLKVDAFGPTQGYLNQEVTWTVRVFNPGDVPLSNVGAECGAAGGSDLPHGEQWGQGHRGVCGVADTGVGGEAACRCAGDGDDYEARRQGDPCRNSRRGPGSGGRLGGANGLDGEAGGLGSEGGVDCGVHWRARITDGDLGLGGSGAGGSTANVYDPSEECRNGGCDPDRSDGGSPCAGESFENGWPDEGHDHGAEGGIRPTGRAAAWLSGGVYDRLSGDAGRDWKAACGAE